MRIWTITDDMTDAQVADALRVQLDSPPRVWRKRLVELRRQGRDTEADWIRDTFLEYVDERMDQHWTDNANRRAVWFDKVIGEQ